MQSGWIKSTNRRGAYIQAHLLKEAVALEEGATALHEFTACVKFFPTLRLQGHEGICINHYSFDRAMYSKLTRLNRARHDLFYEIKSCGSTLTPPMELLRLKEWNVSTPCCNHDCQNSLKWALSSAGITESTHRHLYAILESTRSSFKILHTRLGPFVSGVLRGSADVPPYEDLYRFYVSLGVRPDLADHMSEIRLHWNGKELIVTEEASKKIGIVNKVRTLMLGCMGFRKYTDSRWTTVGDSCRSLMASVALGLRSFFDSCHDDPKCSKYYLAGAKHLDDTVCLYAAVAAVSSVVSDTLLVEMMADDRLASRGAELTALANEELQWIQSLRPQFWTRFTGERLPDSLVCQSDVVIQKYQVTIDMFATFRKRVRCRTFSSPPAYFFPVSGEVESIASERLGLHACASAASVQDKALKSARVQMAFFDVRCLSALRSYPWVLCVGDIEENLKALAKDLWRSTAQGPQCFRAFAIS